tara:strand:- start:3760 stop:5424 length:1665 start_codon:yes stop_codon:yes gene_type:complete
MGILASSPELMTTAQKAMTSGEPVRANSGFAAYMNKNQDKIYPSNLTTYNERNAPTNKKVYGIESAATTDLNKMAKESVDAANERLQIIPSGSADNYGVEKFESIVAPGNKINNENESILNSNVTLHSKNIDNEKTNSSLTGNENKLKTNGNQSMSSQLKNQLNAVNTTQTEAVTALATSNANAEQYEMGGKTIQQRVDDFTRTVNTKGIEPTLADVKDDAMTLLGYNPETLNEQFDEDKQASVWLNMMKAGLAIASGESSNALTNIAKGFSFGLQSYGEDVGKLNKDLRADRKEATNTMYKLLKDEKSERLAKRTLNISEQQGLLNIQKQYVGEEKKKALEMYTMKMANAKWNVTMIGTIAKMDADEQKLAFEKDNLDKTYKLALTKATPKEIIFLKQSGDIKLKDGITTELPFGSPGYFEQYIVSPTGKKKLQSMSDKSTVGDNTDFKFKTRNYAVTGAIGAVSLNLSNQSEEKKKAFGIAAAEHRITLQKITNPIDKLQEILAFTAQQNKLNGAKINFKELTPDQQEDLKQPRAGKGSDSLLKEYANIINL